jgi:hypothetical protein
MADLDIYAQFTIFEGNVTRLVPPYEPRALYGITSALDGHTGLLTPGPVSDSGRINMFVNSLKIKETVTVLRSSDTFSADVSNAYYNKLPIILIVEFDLLDKSLDFWTLGIFQARITKYEIHIPDVQELASSANGEKIVFEFEAANVRFSRGVDPDLSQRGYMYRPRTTREEIRKGLI